MIRLHRIQQAFRKSKALARGFVGGIGSGKTWAGAYDLLRRACPGRLYMATAGTYRMLEDATLRTFLSLARHLHFLRAFHKADMIVVLGNGAEVLFRSTDEPDRLRGPNVSGCWMDEASLSARDAYDILIGRLREAGEQGWLSATFTPRGRRHWTYEVFGSQRSDMALFRARTKDNPFLPKGFEERIRSQYTTAQAAQELGGEFVDIEGALFRREWFPVVEVAPADLLRVRAWDLASTEVKPGHDPDWTAGVLLGRDAHLRYYVLDVRRIRTTPGGVETLVRQTAETDGHGVPVRMEQEPGSSGVAVIDHYLRRVLPGWDFAGVKSSGDKASRARPLAAQAEAGNLLLVRGAWVKDYLDEMEVFPSEAHDDQVDASSLAFLYLTAGPDPGATIGTGGRSAVDAAPAGVFGASGIRDWPRRF